MVGMTPPQGAKSALFKPLIKPVLFPLVIFSLAIAVRIGSLVTEVFEQSVAEVNDVES